MTKIVEENKITAQEPKEDALQQYKLFAETIVLHIYHLSKILEHVEDKVKTKQSKRNIYLLTFYMDRQLRNVSNWLDILYLEGRNYIEGMTCDDILNYKREVFESLYKKKWDFDKFGHWPTHILQIHKHLLSIEQNGKVTSFAGKVEMINVIQILSELHWDFDFLFQKIKEMKDEL